MKQHKISFVIESLVYFRFETKFESIKLCVCSVISDFFPTTTAHQVPLPVGFSRQEHWSGLPFPPPGNFPDPGIEPTSHISCTSWQILYHSAIWKVLHSKGQKCELVPFTMQIPLSPLFCTALVGSGVFFKFRRTGVFQWAFQCKFSNKVVVSNKVITYHDKKVQPSENS